MKTPPFPNPAPEPPHTSTPPKPQPLISETTKVIVDVAGSIREGVPGGFPGCGVFGQRSGALGGAGGVRVLSVRFDDCET